MAQAPNGLKKEWDMKSSRKIMSFISILHSSMLSSVGFNNSTVPLEKSAPFPDYWPTSIKLHWWNDKRESRTMTMFSLKSLDKHSKSHIRTFSPYLSRQRTTSKSGSTMKPCGLSIQRKSTINSVMTSTSGKHSSMKSEKIEKPSITVKLKSILVRLSLTIVWSSTESTQSMTAGTQKF